MKKKMKILFLIVFVFTKMTKWFIMLNYSKLSLIQDQPHVCNSNGLEMTSHLIMLCQIIKICL